MIAQIIKFSFSFINFGFYVAVSLSPATKIFFVNSLTIENIAVAAKH